MSGSRTPRGPAWSRTSPRPGPNRSPGCLTPPVRRVGCPGRATPTALGTSLARQDGLDAGLDLGADRLGGGAGRLGEPGGLVAGGLGGVGEALLRRPASDLGLLEAEHADANHGVGRVLGALADVSDDDVGAHD